MARGRGRGGQARGRGGHTGGGQARTNTANNHRVAKPAVSKLPTSLQLITQEEGVPEPVLQGLTEFTAAQPFFSALERIQPEVATPGRYKTCWLGPPGATITQLDRDTDDSFKATLLMTDDSQHPVFVKRTHIMDPILAIEGETIWPRDGALPAPSELLVSAVEKANDPMNEAYVDAVFAMLADRLVTTNTSPHWCRCFGTFPARVEKYQYNITEEYPSLRRKTFWTRHQRLGIFDVKIEEGEEEDDGDTEINEEIATTPHFQFSEAEEIDVGDFEEVLEIADHKQTSSAPLVEEGDIAMDADPMFEIAQPAVRIRKIKGGDEEDEDSEEDEEDDECNNEIYAEFSDFPVQVSLLERAEGTLEDLLNAEEEGEATDEDKETRWRAWIFQVIAGLATAQHWFGFVHNDLHTNNVMWSRTDAPYLYYRVQSNRGSGSNSNGKTTLYRVPTFGYLMKIIDFGRASYTLPEPAGFFISDAFFPGNDAGHQYNCEPFFDSKNGKKVEPNPSFDLARLAVSMFESLWPERPANATPVKIMSREGPKTYAETTSALYNLMWEWMTDDAGKNILREPNGRERYPDFDLYAAIAADVHRAVPAAQIEKSLFAGYRLSAGESGPTDQPVYDLFV